MTIKRTCKRETCRRQFEPRRTNQLYCDTWCQMLHNQMRYRRKRRERKRAGAAA